MEVSYRQTILAIESAINGGSLSLLRDGIELSCWSGSAAISKAEELLVNIDSMLTATDVSKNDIDMIAVSAGPGSFTGIRIGLATALGLKNGLGVEMSSVSALTAMAAAYETAGNMIVAVPTGRNAICIQRFESDTDLKTIDDPHTITQETFSEMMFSDKNSYFILHGSLCPDLDASVSFTDAGFNIAKCIGQYCAARPAMITEPLFTSKNF